MMPLFHVGGIVRNLLAPVLSGGSVIMCSGFDADAFWTVQNSVGATWYYAAPTMHHAILAAQPTLSASSSNSTLVDPEMASSPAHNDSGRKIRMVCNAAGGLLPSLALELKDTFNGAVILPSYGMTE
jgi:acyl-CoA synthetase (AMP-forming)/AMP-acid ligase II